MTCPDCGTEVAATLLLCPGCQRLVHAEQLKALAAAAEQATTAGDLRTALNRWTEAQRLLPAGSRQGQVIAEKMQALMRQIDAGLSVTAPPAPGPDGQPAPAGTAPEPGGAKGFFSGGGVVAGVVTVGLLVWKLKFIPIFLFTKGKALLLGLTKLPTLATMFVSLSVYWQVFGWWFALGLVVSIYVHEMGHVMALRRLGLPASAPMFVPGLGAFIRMAAYPVTPREDARVGLAGPVWGLGASLLAYALFLASGWKGFAAIGSVGAAINVFNLIPVWQLDGSRGWRALNRWQRWVVALALGAALLVTLHLRVEGILLMSLAVASVAAVVRALGALAGEAPEGDARALVEYLVLIGALTALGSYQVDLR